MAYDVTLAQINAATGGLSRSNTAWGFPVSTNFHTLLMSFWMCGPPAGLSYVGVWPLFAGVGFFAFESGTNGVRLGNQVLGSFVTFYQGTWTLPSPGMLTHFLMSVDTHAQTVQVYVNDAPVTVSGSWTGTPPYDFNVANAGNTWTWSISGTTSPVYPGMGDVWITNPPSFVDLSVTANRRQFINADLTPVDLGNTGTNPFGYQPAMYMSIRPGGAATDILTNLGTGGGAWSYAGSAPSLQDPGACSLPPPPPAKLAMDNVICGVSSAPCQLCLDWSDDRGHTFGVPVCQPMSSWGYLTSLQWQRLGMTRDRVFRLTWTCAEPTALQGAWVTAIAGDEHNEMAGQGGQGSSS